MHYSLAVEVAEAFQNLLGFGCGLLLGENSLVGDELFETAVLGVLEDDLDLAVVGRDVETVVVDDAGVAEFAENPDLPLEGLDLANSLLPGLGSYVDHLQGKKSSVEVVSAEVDLSEGPCAQKRQPLVDAVEGKTLARGLGLRLAADRSATHFLSIIIIQHFPSMQRTFIDGPCPSERIIHI